MNPSGREDSHDGCVGRYRTFRALLNLREIHAACQSKEKLASMQPSQELTMSTTGEKPGKGTYTCKKCGSARVLNDDTDTLPPCSKCNGTEFTP